MKQHLDLKPTNQTKSTKPNQTNQKMPAKKYQTKPKNAQPQLTSNAAK